MQKRILLLFALLFVCCHTNNDLHRTLVFSGDNRVELERVLAHFQNDPEKLQAAEFLIANMSHYYSYADPLLDSLKNVQSRLRHSYRKIDSLTDKWKRISYKKFPKVYDCQVITGDYLINNIEQAFVQWKTKPWNRNLSFDEFCELLLPYRIGDEPIEQWREAYAERYAPILDSLYRGTDVVEAVARLGEDLRNDPFLFAPDLNVPHMGALFLLENRIGTCKDVCDFSVYLMRSLGIPVAVDAFRRKAVHSWAVLKDTTGRYEPFWLDKYQGAIIERGGGDGRLKGKVFRSCFAVQSYDSRGNPLFTKDVTSDYFGHNRIEISLDESFSGRHVYLAIYDRGWYPVDIARAKRGKTIFRDLEPDMIYITLDPDSREISYPFTIDTAGTGHVYMPRKDSLAEAPLWRKVSFWSRIREHLNETAGGRIEFSNDIRFQTLHLAAVMDSTTRFYNYIYPQSAGKYRYVRYIADSAHTAQMAELWIYDTLKSPDRIALRVVEASPKDTLDRLTCGPEAMTDGDVLSFYRSLNRGGHAVFDMGESVAVNKILYIPRNDDNFIHPGDTYELFYQDGINGWHSAGRQEARTTALKYNVPRNAVFLLRDLTCGQEEELFFMDNGVQVFK